MFRFLAAPVLLAMASAVAGGAVAQATTTQAATTGGAVYRRACAACHSVEAGVNRSGPSLAGVAGRPAAAVRGFRYSDVMSGSTTTWTDDALDAFIASPRRAMPGNRMAYAGLTKPEDRAALIQYLRTLR